MPAGHHHYHLDPLGGAAGDMFVAGVLDAFPDLRDGAVKAACAASGVACDLVPHRDHVLTGSRFVVGEDHHYHHHHDDEQHGHDHRHAAWARIRSDLESSSLAPAVRDAGIAELQSYVDTLIVIPNQNLFRLANERTGWKEAFKMADHVLYMGVRGVTDLMMAPGLVNLDFADIRTVMAEMGKAMMGTGEAEGENRAIRAAEAAISNPLLEDTSMAGARGLLINITGGEDMTLFEVDQAANRIREEVADDANIIFGSAVDDSLSGRVRVSVVATGIDTMPVVEAQRPRLVAVGGGTAVAQPMAVSSAGMQPAPAMPMHAMQPQLVAPSPQPSTVSLMGAPVLPQAAAAPEAEAPIQAPAEVQRPRPAPMSAQAPAQQPPARSCRPAPGCSRRHRRPRFRRNISSRLLRLRPRVTPSSGSSPGPFAVAPTQRPRQRRCRNSSGPSRR